MHHNKLLKSSISLLFLLNISSAFATTADSCNACHATSVRQVTKAPQLAGQSAPYLKKQLLQFQNGERGANPQDLTGQQMAAMAKMLTPVEIENLAIFYSQQPATVETGVAVQDGDHGGDHGGLLDQGRRLYIGSCGACHGAKAEGNPLLNAPVLQQLDRRYLQLQLQHFRDGVRGNSKTDKPGRQMALMSRQLSDADIAAVAAYIGAGLP